MSTTPQVIAGIKLATLDQETEAAVVFFHTYINNIDGIISLVKCLDSPQCTLTPEQKGALWDELLLNKLRKKVSEYRPESPSLLSKIFWAAVGFSTACLGFAVYHWKTCRHLRG